MYFTSFDGLLDNVAVRFGCYGAGAAGEAGAGGTADAVEVDFVGLGSFIVDDGGDFGDVEAAGGEVGGEQVGGGGGGERGKG